MPNATHGQPPLVDTHAHLLAAEFAADLPEVLERARQAGVLAIVCVCESLAESEAALELAARYPMVRPAAGVHPDRVAAAGVEPAALLDEVERCCALVLRNPGRFVAIGEVGLDHWRAAEEPPRALQKVMLERFVALSRQTGLPLSVHSRSAGRRTIETLVDAGARAVVLHAFDGRAAVAEAGLKAGYAFSAPPSLVRSEQKKKLFKRLPLEALLLETDSPVLGADPTVRNEPANVALACRALAELRGIDPGELAHRTTARARAIFPGLLV